jgi:hypothetical protein
MNITSSLTLSENKASHIINRLPNPQHLPKLPDRDGSIPLDVQDQVTNLLTNDDAKIVLN